jgi:APA family basic amino acid/polyamine antiporter
MRSRPLDFSVSILTAPRVYYAMARDGVFFKASDASAKVARPVIAIVLQGVWAAIVAITGKYDQILNYVVTIDALFFGLTGAALFVFRRREPAEPGEDFVRVRGTHTRLDCSSSPAGALSSAP